MLVRSNKHFVAAVKIKVFFSIIFPGEKSKVTLVRTLYSEWIPSCKHTVYVVGVLQFMLWEYVVLRYILLRVYTVYIPYIPIYTVYGTYCT